MWSQTAFKTTMMLGEAYKLMSFKTKLVLPGVTAVMSDKVLHGPTSPQGVCGRLMQPTENAVTIDFLECM